MLSLVCEQAIIEAVRTSALSPKKMLRVGLLCGGPDEERDISLRGASQVADALTSLDIDAQLLVCDRHVPKSAAFADVLFPVIHGPWGEGGPLQDELEKCGKPFVGCKSGAARLAMDKIATKMAAARVGVPTLMAGVLNGRDAVPLFGLPCVIKPVHEGSSVGVHICRNAEQWEKGLRAVEADRIKHPHRMYMIERAAIGAREMTVGVLDGEALPIVEIKPAAAVEFYDYEAKYNRDDTQYVVGPVLPGDLATRMQEYAVRVAKEIGVRHLSRVDFLVDKDNQPWLLEVNTLPGFTSHSLFPMAANAVGLDFPKLTARLVELALRDG